METKDTATHFWIGFKKGWLQAGIVTGIFLSGYGLANFARQPQDSTSIIQELAKTKFELRIEQMRTEELQHRLSEFEAYEQARHKAALDGVKRIDEILKGVKP